MNNGYRIVVDAGHGGDDPGAVSGNLKEKDFNLQAANYMYNRFKELGVPVTITRNTDKTLTRQERVNTMTKSFGNDSKVIVLSNHINAGGGEGAEIVYPLRTSSTLPQMILDEIGKEGQIKRKIYQRTLPENSKKDYYYIMRDTPNTTALLIEYGFIDNKSDQVKLKNNINNYAEAVVRAVSEYIGIDYNNNGNTGNNNNNQNNDIVNGYYVVKPGDTLYSIAINNGVTINELIDANNLESTLLNVGQKIYLPNKNIIYIVKPGDTLYSIAKKYNVSLNDLKNINNLNNNVLSINQQLIIPNNSVIEESDYTVYKVVSGDTLYSIAKKFNTTIDDIKKYNQISGNMITVGDILQIPNPIEKNDYIEYQIKRGDTLYSIARNYNINVNDLLSINNVNPNTLKVGSIIKIPIS